jgi:hypothetical protein
MEDGEYRESLLNESNSNWLHRDAEKREHKKDRSVKMRSDMRREHHMLAMDNPIGIENQRRHSSKSECWKNIFDEDELDYIWKWAFKHCAKVRMNRNGTVLPAGNLEKIYKEFAHKIDPLVGPQATLSPEVGGNYFLTPQQYGLHNDSIRPGDWENTLERVPMKDPRRKYTCWKNFIIPLWIGSHHDELDGGQIMFFEERHHDWAHVYNGGGLVPNIASVYKISTDYHADGLKFHDRNGVPKPDEDYKIPFDKEMHKKWCNTPYKRLEGLTVENVFDWVPGNPMSFDAVQLHATNQGTPGKGQNYNAKMGLLLTFLIELDDDLKEEWFLV